MGSTMEPISGDEPLHEVFAINVRRARESRGWSVAMLAYRAGCKAQYIDDIENGKVTPIPADIAGSIAAALGVDVIDLMKRGEPE